MTRRSIAAALLALAGASPAAADWRDPLQWSEVAQCRDAPDRALCILTVVTRHDHGAAVLAQPALANRPDILARVGVDRQALAKAEGEVKATVERMIGPIRDVWQPVGTGGDLGVLQRLIRNGRFEEAAAVSDGATVEVWVEEQLVAAPDRRAKLRQLMRGSRMNAELHLRPRIREAQRAGDFAEANRLEEQLELASQSLPESPSRAELEAEAQAELVRLRANLARLSAEKRPDIARRIADQLLRQGFEPRGGPVDHALLKEAVSLSRHATPAVAAAWAEKLEAQLDQAPSPIDSGWTQGDGLRTAARVWLELKRLDRVEALVQRWMPRAREEMIKGALARIRLDQGRVTEAAAFDVLSSRDFLFHDQLHGRVQENLDQHLKRARTSKERRAVLEACVRARGSTSVALDCLRTLDREASSLSDKRNVATFTLERALASGSGAESSALLTRALEIGAALPDEIGLLSGLQVERAALVHLAALELTSSPPR